MCQDGSEAEIHTNWVLDYCFFTSVGTYLDNCYRTNVGFDLDYCFHTIVGIEYKFGGQPALNITGDEFKAFWNDYNNPSKIA